MANTNDAGASPPLITFDPSDISGLSGSESVYASTGVTFVLIRTGSLSGVSSVNYSVIGTGGDPAQRANAADFVGGVLPAGVITFAAGESSKTLVIHVVNDNVAELDENFIVQLSSPTNATLDGYAGLATILNDDTAPPPAGPVVSLGAAWFDNTETALASGAVFTVSRSGDTSGSSSVSWAVSGTGGSPADAADFQNGVLPSGVLAFAPGETSKTIVIYGANDAVVEPDESFALTLSNPVGASLGNTSTTSVIRNDDQTPVQPSLVAFATSTVSASEGAGGVDITVNRSGNLSVATSVPYSVAGEGASPVSGADFTAGVLPSGQVLFAPGEASKTLHLNFVNDAVTEPDEGFVVILAGASGVILGQSSVHGTIVNDDVATSTIVSVTTILAAGAEDGAGVDFTVIRTGALTGVSTVTYTTAGTGTAPASAADFAGGVFPSGTVTFAAGEASKTIHVNFAHDTTVEHDEDFVFTLANPTGATIGFFNGYGKITNDDGPLTTVSLATLNAAGQEASLAATGLDYVVTRTGDLSGQTFVYWSVAGSGASPASAGDFANGYMPSGEVDFAAGESSKSIHLGFLDDTVWEPDEGFVVNLTGAYNASLGAVTTATGQILNDDKAPPPEISFVTQTLVLPESAVNFDFVLSRTGDLSGTSSVQYLVVRGQISADANDFAGGFMPGGRITFAPGESTQTIHLQVVNDKVIEPNEDFVVLLSYPSNATILREADGALGMILNDDDATTTISMTTTSASGVEGGPGVDFVVTRAGDLSGVSTVAYSTMGEGANTYASAADFAGGVLPSGVLTFAAGESTKTIHIDFADDHDVEYTEGFSLGLSNATGAWLLNAGGHGSIKDNDVAPPTISVSVVNAGGTEGGPGIDIRFTRDGDSSAAATVNYAVTGAGQTPADAADFAGGVLPSGQVAFASGETSKIVHISLVDDKVAEPDENFFVTLSNPVGAALGYQSVGYGTITNDDFAPHVQISYATSSGSEAGPGYDFVISRTGDVSGVSTINYAVQGGTDSSSYTYVTADDFAGGVFPSGTLVFAPGETLKTVHITPLNDDTFENTEFFNFVLSDAVGVAPGSYPLTAGAYITNDDRPSTVSASLQARSSNWNEAALAANGVDLVLTRSGDLTHTASVNYAVTGYNSVSLTYGPADAADFKGGVFPSGVATFAPGQSSVTVHMEIVDDNLWEKSDGFQVVLSNPKEVTLDGAYPYAWINNDDPIPVLPSLSVPDFNVTEGSNGYNYFYLTVTRSGDVREGAAFDYSITSSGASPATASDFEYGLPSGHASFDAGSATTFIMFYVKGDTDYEPNETFTVSFTNPHGLTIATPQATGTIVNDDANILPVISLTSSQYMVLEGDQPITMDFRVDRAGSKAGVSTVAYSVTGYGASPVNGADFAGGVLPTGTVSFGDGETSKVISLVLAGDKIAEGTEQFLLSISNPTGAVLGGAAEVVTVNDNETPSAAPTLALSWNAFDGKEGTGGVTPFTFIVTRSGDVTAPASVAYSVTGVGGASGFAADASDFQNGVFPSGVVSFGAGQTTQSFTVNVVGDTAVEQDEGFAVILSNAMGATIGSGSMIRYIVNDDAPPAQLSFVQTSVSRAEGASGVTALNFTVLRQGSTDGTSSVGYSVTGSGASPADAADFDGGVLPSGRLVFNPYSSVGQITVLVKGDALVEGDEGFTITLSSASNAIIVGGTASGVILNDDAVATPPPTLAIAAVQASQLEGQGPFSFTVSRSGDLSGSTSVAYNVSGFGGTPATAADFSGGTLPAGTLGFATGEATKTIWFNIADDTVAEADEAFSVTLSSPVGASIGVATAVGVILNDDAAAPVGILQPTADSLDTAYRNITRTAATGSAGSWVEASLAAPVSDGQITLTDALAQIVAKAGATTSVASLAYQFFTGSIPSQAGFDYLVSPAGGNANNLNSDYYQSFNLENRYINFAVNLGKLGAGAAAFQADYGGLSLFDATRAAYTKIFGGTPTDAKIHALIDTRADYFAAYGGDGPTGIGTKAAMVGWLLAEAEKADIGMYAKSNDAFLIDLADGAQYGIDLIGVYGKPEYVYAG